MPLWPELPVRRRVLVPLGGVLRRMRQVAPRRGAVRLRGEAPWFVGEVRSRAMGECCENKGAGAVEDTEEVARGLTPEGLKLLVENHARFLAFLERRVGSREVAEEILQEAFVRGIDRGGSLRAGESATAWFYRLLRNALVDHFRRRGAERRALDALAEEPEPVEAAPDAELLGTVCACVGSLVGTLKESYAEALRRVDLEGASVQSYASEAGITPNNAGVRLHRAREALRKQVMQSCGTCATHGCLDCHCDRSRPGGC